MIHNKQSRTLPFVFGSILGVLCTVYLPAYVRPYLPEYLTGEETVVKGTVTAKEKKADALLLTVNTPDGALLATFRKKAEEVNLLINEKDEIHFDLPKYLPFIDDPKITGVVKEKPAPPTPAEVAAAPPEPVEKIAKEPKRRHHMKPQPAAPDPESAMEAKPPHGGNGSPSAGDTEASQ